MAREIGNATRCRLATNENVLWINLKLVGKGGGIVFVELFRVV